MKERQLLDNAIENFIHGAYKKANEDKIIFIKNIKNIITGYSAPFGNYKEHYDFACQALAENPDQNLTFASPLQQIVEKRRKSDRFVRDFKIIHEYPRSFEVMGQMGEGFNWFSFDEFPDLESAYRCLLLTHLTALAPNKMPKIGIKYPQARVSKKGEITLNFEDYLTLATYGPGIRSTWDKYGLESRGNYPITNTETIEITVDEFLANTYKQQLKAFKKFQQK